MNNVPPKLRETMAEDPYYKKCCLANGYCEGTKIDWHHAIIFAGKQLQQKFAIVPVCAGYHHKYAERKDIKEKILRVVLNRATDAELMAISKAIDYKRMRELLNKNN